MKNFPDFIPKIFSQVKPQHKYVFVLPSEGGTTEVSFDAINKIAVHAIYSVRKIKLAKTAVESVDGKVVFEAQHGEKYLTKDEKTVFIDAVEKAINEATGLAIESITIRKVGR